MKKTPYIIDMTDTRLNEIAVAIGAPMNPNRIDFGPQTIMRRRQGRIRRGLTGERTEEIIQKRINRCDYQNDPSGNSE